MNNSDRYTDQLEKNIDGLEVINFGLPGSGTDQQYLTYKEFAQNIDHDAVLVSPLVENIRRVVSRFRLSLDRKGNRAYQPKPYFDLVGSELVLSGVPVKRGLVSESEMSKEELGHSDTGGSHDLIRGLVNKFAPRLKSVIQSASRYQPVPEYDDPNSPAWLLMSSILKKWCVETNEKPFFVCPIPMYHHIEGSASADTYRGRFSELTGSSGINLIDPYPTFAQLSYEDRRKCRFDVDVHLTPFGHSVLATALEPSIRKLMGESVG